MAPKNNNIIRILNKGKFLTEVGLSVLLEVLAEKCPRKILNLKGKRDSKNCLITTSHANTKYQGKLQTFRREPAERLGIISRHEEILCISFSVSMHQLALSEQWKVCCPL